MNGKLNRSVKLPYGMSLDNLMSAVFAVEKRYRGYNEKGPIEEDFGKGALTSAISHKMEKTLPEFDSSFVKNKLSNGYPDILLSGKHKDDKAKHSTDGIEVKVSGCPTEFSIMGSWDRPGWVLVCRYVMNPLRFVGIYIARLTKRDWTFVPRTNGADRHKINGNGLKKLRAGQVYTAT